jgi:hypothetical protein
VIDILDALDVLDSCVRDRGESHRPAGRHGSASGPRSRYARCAPVSDSITTQVLTRAGAPSAAISRLAGRSIGDAYASGERDLGVTVGAVAVLRAAESVERDGGTWGLAQEAAVRAAARFVDLIPAEALRAR